MFVKCFKVPRLFKTKKKAFWKITEVEKFILPVTSEDFKSQTTILANQLNKISNS